MKVGTETTFVRLGTEEKFVEVLTETTFVEVGTEGNIFVEFGTKELVEAEKEVPARCRI